MADKTNLFCPNWLFETSVGLTIYDYITKEYSLEMVAKKFAEGLSKNYQEIPYEEISSPAEECVRFMAELSQSEFEAHERALHFVHYRFKFDGIKGARKLKGLFGSAFDGTKEKKYNEEKTFKDFKAFVFSLRNGSVPKAPSGWNISNEKDLDFFGEIVKGDFSISDLL